MAKKINDQKTDGNKKPVSTGIRSFLKEDMERSGVNYTEEKVDKIIQTYNYDYDKIINDAGKRSGIKDVDSFRNKIYSHYGFQKDEEHVAEIEFLKKPTNTEASGYERYNQLQDDITLAQSMSERLKPQEEELSLMPDFTQPSDVTRVGKPFEAVLAEDKLLTPEHQQARDISGQKEQRIVNLQSKMEEINTAVAEQAKSNIKEFGYASKEHEAIGKEFDKYSSLLKNAITEIEDSSAKHGYGFGFGAGTSAYTPVEAEKVRSIKNIRNIKELYGKMGKILAAPQGKNFSSQMDGLLHGFSDNFFTKDFATLGLNEMSRLLNVKDAFDTQKKFQKEGKTEEEIAELMPEEQKALLETYQQLLQIQAGRKGNFGSAIGEGLKEMIPFIAQFAATGGVGASAKKLVKEFVEAKTKSAVVGKIAGAIAKPLAQAAVMIPAELQNYAQRVAPTMDAQGKLIEGANPLNAAFKAYISTVAEVAGEDIGALTNKWANKAARKNFTNMIANSPTKSQEFLGKMSLALTRETNMPGIQGFVFEGIGEEATGVMQAAIDNDGNFFTMDAQAQIWAMSLMASGSFAALSVPNRISTKMSFNKSLELLNDIPNGDYVKAVEEVTKNYTDPIESLEALDAISPEFEISEEDYYKARNFIGNSVKYNQMNTARAIKVEQQIAQSKGKDGNVTLTPYNGILYSVRNPENLGKEGKVVYLKSQDGTKITPVISSKITDWETKSPDLIIEEQVSQEDMQDEVFNQEQQMQEEAAQRGLIEGNTVETPLGKRTLISINPDGTASVEDQKGEPSVVNTSEIEAYKTKEQKEAEKEAIKADAETLSEGIEEGATVTSDEPLTDESEVRVVDFSNGQSKIITPEGEQVFNTPEERDAAITELVTGEIEAQDDIDTMPADQAFAEMRKTNPEIANDIFTDEINEVRSQAEEARAQVKETKSRKEKQDLLLRAKELDNEAERLDAILADPTLFEQEIEQDAQAKRSEYREVINSEAYEKIPTATKEQLNEINNVFPETIIDHPVFHTSKTSDVIMKTGFQKAYLETSQAFHFHGGSSNSRDFLRNAGGEIQVYLDIKNPKYMLADNLDNETIEELKAQGYDAVINTNATFMGASDPFVEYAVFDQSQIHISEKQKTPEALSVEGVGRVKEVADIPFRTRGINVTERAQIDVKHRQNAIKELNKLQEKFGIPIEVIHSEELSSEAKAKAREIGSPKAFYQNGKAYILSDQIISVSDVKKSYLHEALLHKGLDVIFEAGSVKLLGKTYETKNDLLDNVYSRMDAETIADRAKIYANISVDQLTDIQKRELAEEALATLSETESPRLQVIFDKLYNYIKKLLGFTSKQFTKADLRNVLREHRDLIIKLKKGAETVREDERAVQEGGVVREEGAAEGREDMQQPTEDRAETGNKDKVSFRIAESNQEIDTFLKDSKVQKPAYHQTTAEYEKNILEEGFKAGKERAAKHDFETPYGFFFKSSDKNIGVEGDVQMPVYLNIQNPLEITNRELLQSFIKSNSKKYSDLTDNIKSIDKEYGKKVDNTEKYFDDISMKLEDDPGNVKLQTESDREFDVQDDIIKEWRIKINEASIEAKKVADKIIKDLGYDGVIIEQDAGSFGRITDTIIVFDPNQVLIEKESPKFRVAESKQELKKFVKDSKVKKTVYHATSVEFDEFDISKSADGAIWFSFDKESTLEKQQSGAEASRIIDAKIDLKNPAGWDEYEKYSIDELINEGYDGAILDDDVIVFEPNQILIEPKEDVRFRVNEAAEQVETDPSDAQKKAGNYSLGHVKFDGFDVSIENPKGSIRSGVNQEGEKWSNIMPADYGYFKGTIGNDKDHIDTFLGSNMDSDKVYVVDQVDPVTGKFDEHKVMMGYNSLSEARNAYNEAYDEGWTGLGAITRTTKDGLKEWFKGNTKKPFAPEAEVKFRVKSEDPAIQKMLDRLQAVQDLSKTAERVKGLKVEAMQTLPLERQSILTRIEGIKEGAKLGAKDTKELIKAIQKEITDYAKKSMPLGEAGARDIGSILTLIKEAQTPEAIEKAFERIDELTGQNIDKIERNKYVSKVNRILKWMTGLKKSGTKKVGKFNYTETKAFQELKDINKQAIDLVKKTNSHKASAAEKAEAQSGLDKLWNDLNEKPDKNDLDNVMMKLIELRKLGSKASPKLAQIVSEELEAIYLTAKEAKSQADMIKGIEGRDKKEFVQSFLELDTSLKKLPFYRRAMKNINTGVSDIMGNWETLMTMIGGAELRDKMSFMLNEADMVTGKQETRNSILDSAKDIYNVNSKTGTLNKIHELSKEEYTLHQPNRGGKHGKGDPMNLSKLHLMDIYNAIKNPEVEYDYYMTYGDITLAEDGSRDTDAQKMSGKKEISTLISNLSDSDKEFADAMMKTAQTYKESTNDVFIKIYNRDMPMVENYWPSTAEFEADIDVMSEFVSSGKMPSFSNERASHRKPIPKDAFNKFTKHIDESEWYKNMALPIMDTNKLFKDKNIETLITDKRGTKFHEHIKLALQAITLTPPASVLSSKLTSLLNPLLNNWVASKIGATPSVPLKQLLSAVNYSENMPMKQWAVGFVKNMASPRDTWKTMMEIPYLKARLGDGYSEAVQRALNGDENMHKAKTHNYHTAFKNLMTIGTRYGDITAIVFGGKPYLDYLLKQEGISEKEAVDKFLQDTLRSQQAPFASTLSKLQNSKNPFFRAIFAFSNTVSQYMRKLFEANQNLRVQKKQLDAGKISQEEYNKSRKQTIKVHTIYGLVNTVLFTMASSLINAFMKGSDVDDEIWKDMLNQLTQTYVGGLPVIKDLIGGFTRQTLGMPIYDDSKPFVEGLDEVITEGIKLSKGESKDLSKSYEKVGQGVATMLGVPYYNIKKTIKSIPPFREETFNETRVREVGYKLNDLKKGSDLRLSDAAGDLKKAYSSAKKKINKFKSKGNHSAARKVEKLITKSKVHLWNTEYSTLDMKMELSMFNLISDRIK